MTRSPAYREGCDQRNAKGIAGLARLMTRKRRESSKSKSRNPSAPKSGRAENTCILKLGKGSPFVKSQLRRLPQEDFVWEADFRPAGTFWIAMVVEEEYGYLLADRFLEAPPDVNELAGLLSDAMRRPRSAGESYRPTTIRVRPDLVWTELLPHLAQLEIEVIAGGELPQWDMIFDELTGREARSRRRPSKRGAKRRGLRRPSRIGAKRSLPRTLDEWLDEIEEAWQDAAESIPSGSMIGTPIGEADLFQLAPHVFMKFRGLDAKDEKVRKRVVEGALANYVANTSEGVSAADPLHSEPKLAFALCYVSAHYVLEMIDDELAAEILNYCAERLDEDF